MTKKLELILKMIVLSLGLIAVLSVMFKDKKQSDKVSDIEYDFAMGTTISVNLYNNKNQDTIINNIFEDIKDLDNSLISWRNDNSELGRFNSSYLVNEEYLISDELYMITQDALSLCKDSNGALEITIRPLANLWGIEDTTDKGFVVPKQEEINKALDSVGYEYIQLGKNADNSAYMICSKEDMIVDFGAVGKGYALDRTRKILDKNNCEGAVVTVGGSILVYGNKPNDESFKIGIRDPKKGISDDDMIGYLDFPSGTISFVSTSGGYEKYKTADGKDYHHILDRSTGYPSDSDLASVTIVCDNGLLSDGLSTACFIMGYDQSLSLLKKYNAEAVFIDKDNKVIVTDGLKDIWKQK